MVSEARTFLRYAAELRRFLREREDPGSARARVRDSLARRETNFLDVVRRGVFDRPRSPYRALMDWAGLEYGDVVGLVEREGLEGALARLYEAGVYVTLDEFKGRAPIRRGSQERAVGHEDFDQPLARAYAPGRSGGSGGKRRRMMMDLDMVAHYVSINELFLEAYGLQGRPFGVWRVAPPAFSGIAKPLYQARVGRSTERWFTQNDPSWRGEGPVSAAFTRFTLLACAFYGSPQAFPEYTPVGMEGRIVEWLARHARAGTPVHLDCLASGAVRICQAAKAEGMDISGTFFRVGSEPYTETRARVIRDAGCTAGCHYAMAEAGRVTSACGDPLAVDEGHFLTTKLAAFTRPRDGRGPEAVELHLTSLLPCSPKLMINVETGDSVVVTKRSCGCALGEAGLETHFHGIRSYEKMTGEGVTYLGADLEQLLEGVLPARFGGAPTDYQFVEESDGPLTRLTLVASPRLGPLDEERAVEAVLELLGRGGAGHRMMAGALRDGDTVRVVRREPYVTVTGKVPGFRVSRGPDD